MRFSKEKKKLIENEILKNATYKLSYTQLVKIVSKKMNITPETVRNYIRKMNQEKRMKLEKKDDDNRYYIPVVSKYKFAIDVNSKTDEDTIFKNNINELLIKNNVSENVSFALYYGVTEMLNNAIDHSNSTIIEIEVNISEVDILIYIRDYGVGIFNKIAENLKLDDKRLAMKELYKGKFTSDPENHSGEGIFFTSRIIDMFYIISEDLCFFLHDCDDQVWKNGIGNIDGTVVIMKHFLDSETSSQKVFEKYSDADKNPGFFRTEIKMKQMLLEGEFFISRSQARRISQRFDKFGEVYLDFEGMENIGQGFADELFRVFKKRNPDVKIIPINCNSSVEFMIKRVGIQ